MSVVGEDLKRIYRAMFEALRDDPNRCGCGGWKSPTAEMCFPCSEVERDKREREECLR